MRVTVLLIFVVAIPVHGETEDERVRAYLEGPDGYNRRTEKINNQNLLMQWAYQTNITTYNRQQMVSE